MIRTIAILKKVKSVGDRIYPVLPYSKPCLRIRLNSPQIREEYNRFMKNKDSSWAQKKSISTKTNPVKSQNVKRSWALENVFKTSDTHRISHYQYDFLQINNKWKGEEDFKSHTSKLYWNSFRVHLYFYTLCSFTVVV